MDQAVTKYNECPFRRGDCDTHRCLSSSCKVWERLSVSKRAKGMFEMGAKLRIWNSYMSAKE